ncbi:DUF6415 family natural product biosynthesis protein [Streptomyces roseoverticillatus]|uniref:DUF6415 family natural product biosynthesis protein n=1 Tax=Streptomyces roseoverticillatus TaxID=66429 RepID=UPI0033ED536E
MTALEQGGATVQGGGGGLALALEATEQAFACHAVLPTHQALSALEARLRHHIRHLIPVVEAQAAAMDPEWTGHAIRRSLLARAAQTLAQGPGDGLLSAAEHVCALARVCRALLGHCSGTS